jgi:Family of unknown function (DUF5906)
MPEKISTRAVDAITSLSATTIATDAFQKLVNRIYLKRKHGGQVYFHDLDDGGEVTKSQLAAMLQLMDERITFSVATEAINHLFHLFKPLSTATVYIPNGQPVVTQNEKYFLNSWTLPTVSPKESDASMFVNHLTKALGSADKVDFLLDLLAYRYQKPLAPKPPVVCYFYHQSQGNGKSIFSKTLQMVFGKSALKSVQGSRLTSMSQAELWERTWLVAEEAHVRPSTSLYDTIKHFGSENETDADAKHKGFSTWKIPANLIMLSNRAPEFLEPHDRRFFVCEWKLEMSTTAKETYFSGYIDWLENGGYQAIAWLLKSRVVKRDLHAHAPMTEEKQAAMFIGEDACVCALKDFLEDNSKYRVFDEASFKSILDDYGIKPVQHKVKLVEAGLIQHPNRLVLGVDRVRPWYRSCDKLSALKGHGTTISFDGKTVAASAVFCRDWAL